MQGGDLSFQRNRVLFGHALTPRLLAFELEENGGPAAGEDRIRVFRRGEGGELTSELHPLTPFLFLASPDLLQGWKGTCQVEPLEGKGFLRHLALFPRFSEAVRARDYLQRVSGKSPTAPAAPYLFLSDPVHQYLLLSGQTHFLELPFGQLHRLQLDIETYCQEGFEFSNPNRPEDRVIAITLSDSTGWERLISGRELSEEEMLAEMVREIRQRDPDVIEGHNLFRFDLEYLEARAKRYGIPLALGRDGSALGGHPSRMQIAERTITYRKYEIWGRHIVDTWMLAQHYDILARDLESYGLKEIARHFGLAAPERTYLAPERISWYFQHDPERLFRYAMDDVRETRAIGTLLSRSYFIQAQIFPFSYQNVVLRGNATKIDALFLREYLRQRRALPAPAQGREVAGGYTDIFYQGVARRVLHCDITSLYPSLMLRYGCFPQSDELGIFPQLLQDLKDFRVQAKELARRARESRAGKPGRAAPSGPPAPGDSSGSPEEAASYLEALQSTFKTLINSFYGYLGFEMGHFNDFEQANQVTARGRELIQQMMAWLEERGCRLIEVDTDGIYFVPPEEVRAPEDAEGLIEALSQTLPAGIRLELDGRYQAMFSYKIKNYALLDEQGKLIIKGSGLKSRGLELFQRAWMEEMLRLLLQGDHRGIQRLTERYLDDIEHHRLGIQRLMKTETLQEMLETYRQKTRGKRRNPAAAYELAWKSQRPYQPGDQISYYVAGKGKNVKVHEAARLASQWDPAHPDENTDYYTAKLLELYKKFEPFIQPPASEQLSIPLKAAKT
ncbi:MAG: DNA polymerase II [Candidatus Tectomicrobia bacterium]|uniref:DNA-directed DNA polymerase n=1 Tax=Tectimicrobiota bacterium TaxID=2528274 RepID=A0A932CQW7_UNCTE|nr:DNA polymerase II [Candidatus Tectomicrobia bacterium]